MHTVIVYIVCCIFLFAVFIPGSTLGGIDDVCSQDTLENNTYVSLCPKNSSVSACLPLRVQIYNRLQVMATNSPWRSRRRARTSPASAAAACSARPGCMQSIFPMQQCRLLAETLPFLC